MRARRWREPSSVNDFLLSFLPSQPRQRCVLVTERRPPPMGGGWRCNCPFLHSSCAFRLCLFQPPRFLSATTNSVRKALPAANRRRTDFPPAKREQHGTTPSAVSLRTARSSGHSARERRRAPICPPSSKRPAGGWGAPPRIALHADKGLAAVEGEALGEEERPTVGRTARTPA